MDRHLRHAGIDEVARCELDEAVTGAGAGDAEGVNDVPPVLALEVGARARGRVESG